MNNMEIKVSVKDIPEVIEQLEKADKKINDLQQKIDKAIEYCKKEIGNIIANFDYVDTKDLENILEILGDKE